MGLRDVGASLPPGFRFCPSDDELVCHYLYNKLSNYDHQNPTLLEIDLHMCEPWQLPEMTKLNDEEWYFFSFRDRKYATGSRTNRATTSGYWKATGKDKLIYHPKAHYMVGMRKTLVFYKSRAPNGIKTGWIMHEFRLEDPHIPPKEDWVLCRVFFKSRIENNASMDNINNNCYDKNVLIDTKGGITFPTYDLPLCSMFPNPLHILNQSATALLNLPKVNTSFEFQSFQDQNNVVKISDVSSKYDQNIHKILLDDVNGIFLGDEGMFDQHLEEMGFDGKNNLFFI